MSTDKRNSFSVKKRLESFKFAIRGISYTIKTQHNFRIHVVAALMVLLVGYICKVNFTEWCILVFAIASVFTAEIFNSSIELLTDLLSPQYNKKAGQVKDLAAGAVLLTAIAAFIAGLLIFVPKFTAL